MLLHADEQSSERTGGRYEVGKRRLHSAMPSSTPSSQLPLNRPKFVRNACSAFWRVRGKLCACNSAVHRLAGNIQQSAVRGVRISCGMIYIVLHRNVHSYRSNWMVVMLVIGSAECVKAKLSLTQLFIEHNINQIIMSE